MLRYAKVVKGKMMNHIEPISYEEALDALLGSFKDNDMTRDMLTLPNRITCAWSEIVVQEVNEEGRIIVSAPGLVNLLPMDVEYDGEGNHI